MIDIMTFGFYQIGLILIGILFLHFLGDYVFLPVTECKTSKEFLLYHSMIYGSLLFVYYFITTFFFIDYGRLDKSMVSVVFSLLKLQTILTLINVVSHAVIDYIFVPLKQNKFEEGDLTNFWMAFGFDQFLHTAILLITTSIYAHILVMKLG